MTILESAPIMEYAHVNTYLLMIFFGFLTVVLGLVTGMICFTKDCETAGTFFAAIAAIGLIVFLWGVASVIIEPKTDTGRVQYVVKCDDSITLNEFYNKYKILEHTQYTDVYIVEEITSND